jgi:hypothetical protein
LRICTGRRRGVNPRKRWRDRAWRLPALLGAKAGQHLQGSEASGLVFLGTGRRRRQGGLGGFGRVKLHSADIEVLFEAVELEEVGELERADVSASLADLPLEIADDPLEIGLVEASMEELIPEPFPVKAQAHTLA